MKNPEDMEEFGGHKDPGESPSRDGVPVLPGDEEETCNSCLWCGLRIIKREYKAECQYRDPVGVLPNPCQVYPVDPDGRACHLWRQHPISTFRDRVNRHKRNEYLKSIGEYYDLTPQQRRDDAELARQDKKLGR